MAFETGTASNYLDLLDKLRIFAAANGWTVERWTGGNELILRGEGLSEDQEIFVGFKAEESVPSDYYNWDCRGFTGFQSGDVFTAQPGVSRAKYLSLWNSSIAYWFVVNGQRIIVVAKVSTTYQLGYFGYLFPYGQPSAFPYPLVIAASTGIQAVRWSGTLATHSNLTNPGYLDPADGTTCGSQFYDVGGSWQPIARVLQGTTPNQFWPWCYQTTNALLDSIDVNPDGSYSRLPAVLMQMAPSVNLLGELDGIFWTTGQGLGAEDTVDADYLVVPNIFRSGRGDYCLVELA